MRKIIKGQFYLLLGLHPLQGQLADSEFVGNIQPGAGEDLTDVVPRQCQEERLEVGMLDLEGEILETKVHHLLLSQLQASMVQLTNVTDRDLPTQTLQVRQVEIVRHLQSGDQFQHFQRIFHGGTHEGLLVEIDLLEQVVSLLNISRS